MSNTRQADVFPVTMNDWIQERLSLGPEGRRQLNQEIMARYAWPLQVYFLGTRDRWLGEPADIVQGFFASRLAKGDFFANWSASGLRLRHWLINAFCFYLKELHRARRREAREVAQADEPATAEGNPSKAADRAFAVSIVREGLRMAQAQCEKEKLGPHWEIFVRHFYRGEAYADFAADFGVDAPRAAVMARTARSRFNTAIRDLLSREAPNADPDAEILSLLEETGS
jgi:DNA-directed RNA polymerase specialized sigma24 family protein